MFEFSFRHHRHRRHEECSERDLLLLILLELEEIETKVDRLLPAPPDDAVSGYITFEGESMSDITVPAGTTSEPATATFLDADSNVVAPVDPPVWASSDETVATVAADSGDASGLTAVVSLLGAGSATITATVTNADGIVAVASGTITEEAAPPVSEPVTGDVVFG